MLYYPPMTTWNQRDVRDYHQDVDYRNNQGYITYSIWASKNQLNPYYYSRIYCSLLNWKAYRWEVGIDIDSNGGYWVVPIDMLNDSDLITYWTQ